MGVMGKLTPLGHTLNYVRILFHWQRPVAACVVRNACKTVARRQQYASMMLPRFFQGDFKAFNARAFCFLCSHWQDARRKNEVLSLGGRVGGLGCSAQSNGLNSSVPTDGLSFGVRPIGLRFGLRFNCLNFSVRLHGLSLGARPDGLSLGGRLGGLSWSAQLNLLRCGVRPNGLSRNLRTNGLPFGLRLNG